MKKHFPRWKLAANKHSAGRLAGDWKSDMKQPRSFDLNIETILEGWENCHAIRELVANALDEQALTGTPDIDIGQQRDGSWYIRDFGRGLRYEHLTQNENEEKLQQPSKVIGKFGVGLKDALATLNRHSVNVSVRSRYGDITLGQEPKHGFADIVTLHAIIKPPDDPGFIGTAIVLDGVTKEDMATAKSFFLRFSGEPLLDTTRVGEILRKRQGRKSRIYVTGLLVAEEDNFAFSYNVTALTKQMTKALNRERTNVGRDAYRDRVKEMLLETRNATIAGVLAQELGKIERGTNCDEVTWMDVARHAARILNAQKQVLWVSASQILEYGDMLDHAKAEGLTVVTVPDNIMDSIGGLKDIAGNDVRDISVYRKEWERSFKFKFIDYKDLRDSERAVFDRRHAIALLGRGLPKAVKDIKITETMRPDFLGGDHTEGLWDPASGNIVIRRDQLQSLTAFAGTLLHEMVHARTGHRDITHEFENELTNALGSVATGRLTKAGRWEKS